MASFVWSDIPKLSFGSCSSLIKLSCLRLAMGHSYLVSLGGSRSSEADLGPTLLPLPAWKASDHSTWKADFSPGTYDHHYSSSNKEHIEYIRKPGREPTAHAENWISPGSACKVNFWGQRSTDKPRALSHGLGTRQAYTLTHLHAHLRGNVLTVTDRQTHRCASEDRHNPNVFDSDSGVAKLVLQL